MEDIIKKVTFSLKRFVLVFLTVVVLGLVLYVFVLVATKTTTNILNQNVFDVKNMTYVVAGETFTLKDGKAVKDIVGRISKNTLMIFGEPVYGDLNNDGKTSDAVFWLINTPGGSGAFYYAVLVIDNGKSSKPTNAMFLGDRIAPQTVNILDGRAVFNFAERRADEPMTTMPSIGKSVWINYDAKTNEIGEWVKDFEGEAANNNIHVSYPISNNEISSPLVVKGEAKGTWFFEASFPVVLTNWDGLIIAEGVAKAEGDWMTENFVPFTATLTFTKPNYGKNGFLLLKKDNPSGLPQNDDSLEIPVNFK